MALILHYPLDGDMKDYSGSGNHASMIENGVSISSNGKIGKCYIRKAVNDGVGRISSSSKINLQGDFTMAVWAKVIQCDPGTANGIITNHNHSTNTGAGITIKYISNTDFRMSCNTGDGSDRTYQTYYGETNIHNRWAHLLLRYEKKTNTFSLWVDGEKDFEFVYKQKNIEEYVSVFAWSIGLLASNRYRPRSDINDVRIYDHALSVNEIKELVKAKILHYDFNSNQEPTKNLLYRFNPRLDQSYSRYIYTNTGTWASKHPDALVVYNDDGDNITSSGYVNTGLDDYPNLYHASWVLDHSLGKPVIIMRDKIGSWQAQYMLLGTGVSLGFKAGSKYTISWRQWTTDISKSARAGVYGPNTSGTYHFHDGQSHEQPSSFNTKTKTWQRVYATFTVSSSRNLNGNLYVYFYGHHAPRGELRISDIQLELKSHPTNFVKKERTGIIGDMSGYGNSSPSLLDSTPQWELRGPIGRGSYNFNGQNHYIVVPGGKGKPTQQVTIAAWAYRSNWNESGSERIISSTESGGWQLGFNDRAGYLSMPLYLQQTGSYEHVVFPLSSIEPGWHHIVGTFDGRVMKLYIDGELVDTNDLGYHSLIGYHHTNAVIVGAEPTGSATTPGGQYWSGKIADVRIYGSSLTEKDIVELYQKRMSVDSEGTLNAIVLEETPDLWGPIQQSVLQKTYSNGLSYYGQANCQVTLTDRGFRIYRPPNKNPTDDGLTMWGGLRIINEEPGGFRLKKGHRYRIEIDVSGHTDNPMHGLYWSNNMGWGGGGLMPSPTIHSRWQPGSGFTGEATMHYEFTIEDDIWKRCTSSYSIFTEGVDYLSYKHFAAGFSYLNTGPRGTDLYLNNFRLYDLTDNAENIFSLTEAGVLKAKEIRDIGMEIRYIRDTTNGSTVNTGNHWVEIQAFGLGGNNVALGKNSSDPLLVDGSTATSPYFGMGSGVKTVEVDLGMVQHVSHLKIWHYWGDGRTYHDVKTEVSRDGINWETVFDSNVDGEYKESSSGKTIYLYPNKLEITKDGVIYAPQIKEGL